MKWFRNAAFSLRALNRARVRTVLSACSMTIGIAAMFILFSLGAGSERAFETALASMGKNLLAVGSVRRETDALRGQGRRFQTLTLDDWRAISSEVAGVERAAPIAMNNFDVRYGGRATNVTVIEEDAGRFFSSRDTTTCWTDIDRQEKAPPGSDGSRQDEYLISGVLYCVAPLAELHGNTSLRFSDLRFVGRLNW